MVRHKRMKKSSKMIPYIITITLIFIVATTTGGLIFGWEETFKEMLKYTIGFTASVIIVFLVGMIINKKGMIKLTKNIFK